jgi:hypothetical protein
MENQENNSKPMRILGIMTVTIILGAIGSGVWEFFLSSFVNHCIEFCISISHNFENSIYEVIGSGNKDIINFYFYSFFHVFIILIPLVCAFLMYRLKLIKENPEKTVSLIGGRRIINFIEGPKQTKEDIIKAKKRFKIFSSYIYIPLCLIITGNIIFNYSARVFVYGEIVRIDQQMEIIAPYINEDERIKLKSTIRQISSKKEHDDIIKTLTEISDSKKLKNLYNN